MRKQPLNLVVENDPDYSGIPKELRGILDTRFLENREYWFGFTDQYRADPKSCMARLLSLQTGDSMIGQTNFHDEDALEKTVILLNALKAAGISINLYTLLAEEIYGTLEAAFEKYLSRTTCFVTPEGYNEVDYKEMFNLVVVDVLRYHKVYRIVSSNSKEDVRLLINVPEYV